MRRALALAIVATLVAGPSVAAPNAQLVASVQNRLDRLGFSAVEADRLSTRQIAALHLQLQGRALDFGPQRLTTRQRVKTILRWDPPTR
ncbi:hypothetical protein JANAI62_14320 [Jannaschia pagri]|uniref:Peptidoglycan binding domain-containing protein n=1 Tax=Jannaschia pagri TaxID=2829797 RepID=A0ABQ4NK68_9RHOB|nr:MULTISPECIES: hypothetical protein [unclassified Jannaschia]GIT90977.1 hypothetical protein JANAI61_14350 [Jannaschia sp. AI_61]GIT94809.1 hypothetical protein JANAI62_14320 [Jannaschia sp. AI_62]